MAEHYIPEANVPALVKKLEAMARKATRLGCAPPTWAVGPAAPMVEVYTCTNSAEGSQCDYLWWPAGVWEAARPAVRKMFKATGRACSMCTVTVTGTAPQLGGWVFIAKLTPMQRADGVWENMVATMPGETCPPAARLAIGRCDHCGKQRYRKETFVVRNAAGLVQCVGRQCLADFLGSANPDDLARYASWLAAEDNGENKDEDSFGTYGAHAAYGTLHTLAWVASVVRVDGWLSRTLAAELGPDATATADRVLLYRNGPTSFWTSAVYAAWHERQPTEEDMALAATVQAWAAGMGEETVGNSDYLRNLRLACSCPYVHSGALGVLCSAVAAWQRVHSPKPARPAKPVSVYQGAVGERIERTVQVVCVVELPGQWSTRGLHIMLDTEGNKYTWCTSGSTWLDVGVPYRIKGTVKDHSVYKGEQQTVLLRVKAEELEGDANDTTK